MAKLSNSNFMKLIAVYSLYNVLVCMFHIFLISIIAFFHFLLNHSLGVIENWIFSNGWEIVILAKAISFYCILKFFKLNSMYAFSIKTAIKHGLIRPNKELLVVITFLFLFTVFLGRPSPTDHINNEFFKNIISYGGTLLFFAFDFIIIKVLDTHYPSGKLHRAIKIIFFPLIMIIFSKISFLYAKNINFLSYFILLICLYLGDWRTNNWSFPILFLILFACPVSTLLGQDLIWGSTFSIYQLSSPLKPSHFTTIVLIMLSYLNFKSFRFNQEKFS